MKMGFINKILHGDALTMLKQLPDNSVDCCVTSPPYWGLRNYGVEGQLGLEATPELFIEKMVEVFAEVKRVLKSTGTCWLNIGDSYAGSGKGAATHPGTNGQWKQGTNKGTHNKALHNFKSDSIKAKDLVGIPWMLAFALRADGWYLRQDIIWAKPNPMPESVTDRCTKAHEYIFLLTKSNRYYYDSEAIKEASKNPQDDIRRIEKATINGKSTPDELKNGIRKNPSVGGKKHKNLEDKGQQLHSIHRTRNEHGNEFISAKSNKRSVWTICTEAFSEAHFATFPQRLIEDCIKAGSSEYGCCVECGKPWERIIEKQSHYDHTTTKIGKSKDGPYSSQTGNGSGTHDVRHGVMVSSETTGWQATCKCRLAGDLQVPVSPSVILDPFSGAATTFLVAKKLNRNAIGIELNTEYIKLSERRLKKELGMFYKPIAA